MKIGETKVVTLNFKELRDARFDDNTVCPMSIAAARAMKLPVKGQLHHFSSGVIHSRIFVDGGKPREYFELHLFNKSKDDDRCIYRVVRDVNEDILKAKWWQKTLWWFGINRPSLKVAVTRTESYNDPVNS